MGRRAPSPSLRERSSSSESSHTRARVRRGRSPNRGDHTEARDKSTSQKIRDLDARLDAINTGTNAPVTVDALVRQTDPPFTKRVLGARISSKFKLPTQLGIYEGKTDPMDHLDSYKSLMSLQGCSDEVMCKAFSATLKGPKNASHLFTIHQKETESLKDFVKRFNQAILEVEDPSDKVIIMAMMEGLRPSPLFDSLSKNVPETLSALQSKADKYIAAEELAEAKRRRRGKDDHKRKEPDTRRNDYREETRYKRPDRDPKRSNNRRPRTPPRRPEFILPPLNAPVAQNTPQPETTPLEAEIPKEPAQEKDLAHWILFVDGSSNQHGCGAGLVIRAPLGEQMEYAIRMGFKATNNEAEYEALLAGLRVATELGAQSLEVFSDSQLVVNQVQGDYLAKDARMIAYFGRAISSIGIANQVLHAEESPTWMDEIIAYLQDGILPKEKLQARRLQYRSARFCIFNGKLYKRSFSGPLLKCLRPEEAEYVLKEIHEGICGNHSGARSFSTENNSPRIFLADHGTRCGCICQEMRQMSEICPRQPSPPHRDGTDVKPLAIRPMGNRHIGFGIPKVIISDNARQFDNDKFRLFCSDLAISHHFSSPGHPQANGQVEVTNRTILRNLKARLERSKSEWAEDLPSILWAYHTTSRIPTGETPYSMVFGTESVIPVEIGMPSFRMLYFDKNGNEGELKLNLDLLDEKRESTELSQAAYKNRIAKYYNERVKHRSFLPGDLVLRRVTLSTRDPSAGKLGPTWEGPYKVIKVSRPGTYWLEDLNGKTLLHPWNAEHLKKYYQ
ncbi:hypothetical protein Acr_05g0004870 [Actinidia rufa]|uniref:Integrase catalytic domain-containing protein n=1 Tax=Actinidia rufa TaxID=165716 RepID=A0A7J0EK62_9ERIC|nr:hypothetical protein Acr_05g0004870 [Actinidia rufa]